MSRRGFLGALAALLPFGAALGGGVPSSTTGACGACELVQISDELLRDSSVDIGAYLGQGFTRGEIQLSGYWD